MKKQLFFAAVVALGSVGITSAQQSFSFETSEGFTTGSLLPQNGNWTIINPASDGHLFITTEQASNGSQSLQFLAADTEPEQLIGVSADINPGGNVFTISQDVYPNSIDTENGSDFILFAHDLQGSQNTAEVPASILYFDYEGGIYVVTAYNVAQEIFEAQEVSSFEAGNWYNIKATYNLTAATVTYFVNNTQVYTGPLMNGGTEINRINYSFDDFTTSYFLDNITISTPTAGNPEYNTVTFTAYPNPAQTELNIAQNGADAIQHISISDMNGRVVKTITPSGTEVTRANIADLSNGIYILNVATAKGNTTKKIVKS
ncbi:T9SS type A sorting domain-containing protein [Flavobacterium sp. RHBU_3]|uniref:T9SS type A sorting domain-containing protein n=1 Tax=Flavobacterium sp. RHBU_3 TaxID=3391184 RepID=UPI003984F761